MTVLLVALVIACVVWVGFALMARRGTGDPSQTVDGFARALHALAPEVPEDDAKPRRRGWRRHRL